MPNILTDIATAFNLEMDIRKERKAGRTDRIGEVYTIPVVKFGYWGWAPEACLFYEKKWKPVRDVFDSFPEETQHALTFAPKDGEWTARVELWEEPMRAALPPELYAEAMAILFEWALSCTERRAAEV